MQTDTGRVASRGDGSRSAPQGWRPPRWLWWTVVLVCSLVGTLAVIGGWGPLLLWLIAAGIALVGFFARRRRWWGLALFAAALVVVVAVPVEVPLRIQAIASVAVFAVVALVWLAIRRQLFAVLPRSQRPHERPAPDPRAPRPDDGRGLFGSRRIPTPGWRLVFIPPLIGALILVFALFGALSSPGNQNLEAKWADWLRGHHAAGLASDFEKVYYQHNAPARGGHISRLNAVPRVHSLKSITGTQPVVAPPPSNFLPPPAPVPLVVQPGLPGEGRWAPTGPLVHGQPGLYVAQFRADNIYTSQITSAVWIDPKLVQVSLVPGSQEPGGGPWPQPPYVPAGELPHLVGAFNGGFRTQDAHGGVYLDGRTAVPLVPGAASVVMYQDGHIDIGRWGTEVTMTPQVSAVLQNLIMIVDNGQAAPEATYSDARLWGHTLGAKTVVARSGIGVTANGALVYVAGPALTAKSLAESLQRVGAVRAMTLDINPEWVTFNFYEPAPTLPDGVVGSKLYPQMERPADRYLPPTRESRDFFMLTMNGTGP